MEAQMRVHTNLRRLIACRFGCYFWRSREDDDDVPDAADHLITWNKRASNENQLQEFVGTISSRPLISDRSPWEVVLIPFGRRWSILIRAHHLLVDGDFALEEFLRPTSFGIWTDRTPPLLRHQSAVRAALSSAWSEYFLKWTIEVYKLIDIESTRVLSRWKGNPVESLFRFATLPRFPSFDKIVRLIQAPIYAFFGVVLFFWRTLTFFFYRAFSVAWTDLAASPATVEAAVEIRECVKLAMIAPHAIATQLTFRVESVPLLRANVSPGYRVLAWTPPVTNTLLQRVAEAGNASEEHVLLAAIAGSLRHFLLSNGADVPDSVSAIIPVAVGERQTRAFALVDLPTGEWDPCVRLRLVRRQLLAVEERPLNVVVGALAMEWATLVLPQPLLTMALNFLSRRHPITVCCVNAPSGRRASPLVEATRLFYWRPPQGNAGLTFTLLLGDEHVTMAVASSQRVLPKPTVLTSQFSREIHAMAVALRVKLDKKWTKLSPASD